MATRVGLLLWLAGTVAGSAFAQIPEWQQRAGKWQFYIPFSYVAGTDWAGQGGTQVEVSDDIGFGFGFGYNMDNRFMLGFEASWTQASYDALLHIDNDGDMLSDGTTTLGGWLDASSVQGVGQLNLLAEKKVTPFLKGNLGFTYVDSNIPSGPTQGTCWWDPWWGYICDAWQPTFDRFSFSFGGGAGLRAELGDRFYLEGSVTGNWIDMPESLPFFLGGRLNVGWLF